jgi:anti-sigma factor RsiW
MQRFCRLAQNLPPEAPAASPAVCSLVRAQLDAFVDGELTLHDACDRPLVPLVQEHLASCAPCTRLAQQLSALRAAL